MNSALLPLRVHSSRVLAVMLAMTLVATQLAWPQPVSAHPDHVETATADDITQRDRLIAEQEALLNSLRCRFDIDTQIVSDGCNNKLPVRSEPNPIPFTGNATPEDVTNRDHLIENQEALLNRYRCMFNIDTQLVPDNCTTIGNIDVIRAGFNSLAGVAWSISPNSHDEDWDGTVPPAYRPKTFGGNIYDWDQNRRIIIKKIPVEHPEWKEMRGFRWNGDVNVTDTPENREFVTKCVNLGLENRPGWNALDEDIGGFSAEYGERCFGALHQIVFYKIKYRLNESNPDVMECWEQYTIRYNGVGKDAPRFEYAKQEGGGSTWYQTIAPTSLCPSIAYDPTQLPVDWETTDWVAKRCAEIVDTNPNPDYPVGMGKNAEGVYPSCFLDTINRVKAEAAAASAIGERSKHLPDSMSLLTPPHHLASPIFHQFFGYVWARQTGKDNTSPELFTFFNHYYG